ncbi:MAG: hypothetical protein ACLTSZ_19725 [Lachnospiraceae bacterium]
MYIRFIDLVNKIKATFSGLDRTDVRDYPEEAVREALLNSIVHRDYSFSGKAIRSISMTTALSLFPWADWSQDWN